MDSIFKWCVDFLVWLADKIEMTYNEVNIWIFVIIEPVIFLVMVSVILLQRKKIKSLKRQMKI
jgi:hypothetical protein